MAASPLKETLSEHRGGIWSALGMRISENVFGYMVLTFSITYIVQTVDANADYITGGIAAAGLFGCLTYYLAAWASDRFGRRRVFIAGGIFALLYCYPFFLLLDTGNVALTYVALMLGWGLAAGIQFGIQPAYFPELFGKRVKYTGISVGYQLGSVLGGGFAPFIATALLAAGGGSPVYVIIYLTLCAAVSLVTAIRSRDPYYDALKAEQTETDARVPSLHPSREWTREGR